MSDSEFACEKCPKVFANRRYLSQHVRRNHGPSSQILRCIPCNFQTKFKSALKRHSVRHVPRPKPKLHSCILCHQFQCEVRDEMIEHYVNVHEVQLSSRVVSFDCYQNFEKWKSDIEAADVCKFTFSSGKKERKAVDVRYYRCFRDGVFHPEGKGERRLKFEGSIKIGGICPASMKVVIEKETGVVHVTFIPNHVGHSEYLGRLNLTKAERAEIARKLAKNIPSQVILDQIITSKRRTSKNIANVQASFNLQKVDRGYHHTNDGTSVDAWIQGMKQETNMVRFFKPRGVVLSTHPQLLEDDMLLIIASDKQLEMLKKYGADCICFDGTHSSNPNELELTTVFVLNELRQGFPCLFLFSSRCDTEIMSLLVSVLQCEVGSVQPNVFMTDMSLIYINGWRSCMPEPRNLLFCNWHVDRAWRENLDKVKGTEKKKEVYRAVRTLMEETDEAAFLQLEEKTLEKFGNDPCTADFGDYFKETFSKNAKQWAFCYRKNCGLNTNIHLESMHRVLKYIYLDGKKVKRLDRTISALLRLVRDKFHDRLIAGTRGKLTSKNQAIKKRHDASVGLSCTVLPCAEGWLVKSKSGVDLYLVQKLTNDCCDCELKCLDCKICIHDFTCNCIDSMVKFNICEHIHLVASCRATNERTCEPAEGSDDYDDLLSCADYNVSREETIITETSKNEVMEVSEDSLKNKISKIREKFDEILENLQTDEHVDILLNTLLPVIPALVGD